MTPDKMMIWAFLLVAVSALAIHVLFLWRGVMVDTLRLELLEIETALVTRIPAPALTGGAIRRLQTLIATSRRYADSLNFSRVWLAHFFLPEGARQGPSCRQSLRELEDPLCREASLLLYADFERAVSRRMTFGSPLLWMFWLYRAVLPPSRRSAAPLGPQFDLLESTFPECIPLWPGRPEPRS